MTAREFRKDEILTLRGGDTWRVDQVYPNNAGRVLVGLVNPFNPNHGTAFYADALPSCLAERPVPPPLTPTMPPCSVCGEETECDADGFRCTACRCTWHVVGDEPGGWDDFQATQCTSVIRPFADFTGDRYRAIRGTTYRCVLDADHEGDLHQGLDYHWSWRDNDERAIPAEKPVEATS
ncbi:hypothetical protein [Amycolatopsis sp. BJA-103]|uniref:hypothetical protein n=1 Tax=Amycolatopsis sp. BJA-103 TaxID=1911175 RepID=UPI000C782776|nr:hypothetical protein [Amycolatopsis sp. BJA-103]AUI56809.1 hypothetical protein BKN51_00330 [Amycolatopsis sp. BJA-103]PNE13452.1 hypothetical protein B1H26_40200 [Amycolatopsis sp. BJA-103]